jgi:hypothetical protein
LDKTFAKILKELDYPPVFLISIEQYEHIDGCSLEGDYGVASVDYPVFAIQKGLRGRVKENVIWHELAHHLWPWRQHWWVEAFAEKMARGGGKGYYCTKYGHSVDELPPRSYLLKLARRASKRMKR